MQHEITFRIILTLFKAFFKIMNIENLFVFPEKVDFLRRPLSRLEM